MLREGAATKFRNWSIAFYRVLVLLFEITVYYLAYMCS